MGGGRGRQGVGGKADAEGGIDEEEEELGCLVDKKSGSDGEVSLRSLYKKVEVGIDAGVMSR